jgi:hypothetical protein
VWGGPQPITIGGRPGSSGGIETSGGGDVVVVVTGGRDVADGWPNTGGGVTPPVGAGMPGVAAASDGGSCVPVDVGDVLSADEGSTDGDVGRPAGAGRCVHSPVAGSGPSSSDVPVVIW